MVNEDGIGWLCEDGQVASCLVWVRCGVKWRKVNLGGARVNSEVRRICIGYDAVEMSKTTTGES